LLAPFVRQECIKIHRPPHRAHNAQPVDMVAPRVRCCTCALDSAGLALTLALRPRRARTVQRERAKSALANRAARAARRDSSPE
jgi:hypothetical protein